MTLLTVRRAGLLALLTPLWFWGVYAVMAAVRPDFSHFTDAISELGSLDALSDLPLVCQIRIGHKGFVKSWSEVAVALRVVFA